jgi:thiol-disulfide isomerase/thioredoxin
VTALLLAALLAGNLDAKGVHAAVAKHKGRPVVVNFWATWCGPCVAEFPDLVRLAGERKDVTFLSVTIDDPAERGAVETFLAKQKPTFPVYLKAPGGDEAFITGIDAKWSGAVPLTLIYDAAGKKVAQIEGEATRKSIEAQLPPARAAKK